MPGRGCLEIRTFDVADDFDSFSRHSISRHVTDDLHPSSNLRSRQTSDLVKLAEDRGTLDDVHLRDYPALSSFVQLWIFCQASSSSGAAGITAGQRHTETRLKKGEKEAPSISDLKFVLPHAEPPFSALPSGSLAAFR